MTLSLCILMYTHYMKKPKYTYTLIYINILGPPPKLPSQPISKVRQLCPQHEYSHLMGIGISTSRLSPLHSISTARVSPHNKYLHFTGISTSRVSPLYGYLHITGISTSRVSPRHGYLYFTGISTSQYLHSSSIST